MLSLKDVAATKVAIEICNNSDLKREILCLPGSDYDVNEARECKYRKRIFDEILEKKARIVLENLCLTTNLHGKVIYIVLSVGIRMLSWAKYYEKAIGLSRIYSFNFLKSSFFTTRGIIDCRKAGEELMNDKRLSKKEKYKVSLYCMNDQIPALFKQLSETDKAEFYDSENPSRIKQPHFIKFWSYYLKDEVDKVREDADPNLYWIQMAVKSGNKDAVEYCLKQTNLITDENALMHAALEAVKNNNEGTDDLFVFRNVLEDDDSRNPWVPNHYYVDILCFLFSKMKLDTQVAFLKADIKGLNYEQHPMFERSRVLEFFLDWPYQDFFLKTVSLMWGFLSGQSYFNLIERFALRDVISHYKYKEEFSYDYTVFLWEFLNKIPESNKRYVFRDCEFDFGDGNTEIENAATLLLYCLFTQINYTYQDKIITDWILNNATNEEREKIISSRDGISTCTDLMALGRWKLLDEFVSHCYTSGDKVQKFKTELTFTEVAYNTCISFIAADKWHEVESFIDWSSLSNVEINQLKEKMILTEYGKDTCLKIISHDTKLTSVDKLIRWWSFPTVEKVSAFKKELCFCPKGMQKCVVLVTEDEVELANAFINWSLSSEEEIRQYKINLAYAIGKNVIKKHIFDINVEHNTNNRGNNQTSPLNVDNWEDVEKILNWCFSSEDELNDFKKYFAMKNTDGTRDGVIHLHFNLMLAYKWKEAEILFAWLNLSIKEIRELKKETILSTYFMTWMDLFVLQNTSIVNDLEHWEKVRLFLRWCLEHEDDVLEFKNKFVELFGFKRYGNDGKDIPDDTRNNLAQLHIIIKELLDNIC